MKTETLEVDDFFLRGPFPLCREEKGYFPFRARWLKGYMLNITLLIFCSFASHLHLQPLSRYRADDRHLGLLNDISIMMIAYDNTKLLQKPVRWDMCKVMILAIVLGVTGVFSTFLLFFIAEEVLYLDRMIIQTLIFLKLAVAGHMTVYHARTGEHPFWIRPLPAAALFWTTEITQVVGTLVAIYGIFMEPIGWALARLVWGYALAFFVLTNYIKIYALKLADHSGIIFHR